MVLEDRAVIRRDGEFPFYSFKPNLLRGPAHAVTCTTPPYRYAGRLNSGVRPLVTYVHLKGVTTHDLRHRSRRDCRQ